MEYKSNSNSTEIGFIALAFIAEYNVDKPFAKIEDVAKSIWWIDKSNASYLSELSLNSHNQKK